MAEKQFAFSGGKNDEFFADDDPLAELARIVGFEPRPAAPVAPVARQEPVMEERPPEFALEDELLREFALYDAPRLDPIGEFTLDDAAAGGQSEGAVFEEARAPEPLEPTSEPESPAEAVEFSYIGEAVSPVEDLLEDELSDVDLSSDYGLVSPNDAAADPEADQYTYPVHAIDARDRGVTDEAGDEDVARARKVEDVFLFEALADELEQSIADVVAEAAPAPQPVIAPGEQPRFRLPLANFNVAAARQSVGAAVVEPPAPVVEPVAAEPSIERAPDLDYDIGADWRASVFTEGSGVEKKVSPPQASIDEHLPSAESGNDIDDLLAEVERYSIPPKEPAPYRLDTATAPLVVEAARPQTTASVFAQPSNLSSPVRQPEPEEAFVEGEFEFDLDGIELELSDMTFDTPVAAAPAPMTEAPKPVLAPVAPMPVQAAAAPLSWTSPVAATSTVMGPGAAVSINRPAIHTAHQESNEVFARPASARPVAPAQAAVPLPFDPELIAEAEDHLETLPELDVPALPVIEKEEPVAFQPEYDIDIDAEMASLFEPVSAQGEEPKAVENTLAATAWAPSAKNGTSGPQVPLDDFDEFEKALEQDLRQTLKEPYGGDAHVAKMTLDRAIAGSARGRSRSLKGMLLASSLLVVCGAGAYGAYSWLFGDASGSSSGGPVVISADKDPVKVVPQDRGGKTVPNQDKAVYDRVAGATASDPKQEKLVTSDEEPVDVVQRTLTPDNLPLEGAEDELSFEPTPAGETEDERLLPSDSSEQATPAQENTPAGIAARKVRSMIVKPDGTIVARELPSEPVEEQMVASAAPAAPTAAPKVGKPALADSTEAAPDPEIAAVSSTRETQPSPDAASQVASITGNGAGEPAPVRSVKTSAVTDAAPLPEARPVAPEVKVAAAPVQASAPAEEAPAAPEPTQVASIAPGGYFVQVASLPSEAEAQKSYQNLSRKFGSVIGGRGVDIKRAEIEGKGTYYRVRIPAGSKDEAVALCEDYRAAGGSCLIAK
ncbi:SPOR domain-containing protein [Rhizobiaceae bacterium n13]|uniref:SPOR domain-containing protein n=1 Tax=Ferirhizobium litorale TaxID=2927786 RepID=A0AAE3U2P8_9HYPH|nr:SPOR domain-containing protein [Fererhizobium litorale]MDI7863334.1 SPOR domain-containing protein [Fererhizobium litorale]MDI7922932.1 SPOR domain-containing protein [Fererhizobium litorale]